MKVTVSQFLNYKSREDDSFEALKLFYLHTNMNYSKTRTINFA